MGRIVLLFSLFIRLTFLQMHLGIKVFQGTPKAAPGVPFRRFSMTLKPWFLATVSLGLVALLLMVRGESPAAALDRLLDEALDPDRPL
jgi:hypothetical protein